MGLMKDIFKVKNILIGLKALVVSILFGLVWLLWTGIAGWLGAQGTTAQFVAKVLLIALLIVGLFLWGYIANRIWRWK